MKLRRLAALVSAAVLVLGMVSAVSAWPNAADRRRVTTAVSHATCSSRRRDVRARRSPADCEPTSRRECSTDRA